MVFAMQLQFAQLLHGFHLSQRKGDLELPGITVHCQLIRASGCLDQIGIGWHGIEFPHGRCCSFPLIQLIQIQVFFSVCWRDIQDKGLRELAQLLLHFLRTGIAIRPGLPFIDGLDFRMLFAISFLIPGKTCHGFLAFLELLTTFGQQLVFIQGRRPDLIEMQVGLPQLCIREQTLPEVHELIGKCFLDAFLIAQFQTADLQRHRAMIIAAIGK